MKLIIMIFLWNLINNQNNSQSINRCNIDSDCLSSNLLCKNNICSQKPVFPLTLLEFLAFLILIIISFFSLIAGVGGGAIIVPIAIILLSFDIRHSTGFSNFIILLNSFTRYLFNIFKNDPLKSHKTLIDYDMILIFNPTLLFGTFIGVIINNIIPDIIIVILLSIIIILSVIKTIKKTISFYKKEVKIIKNTNKVAEINNKSSNKMVKKNLNENSIQNGIENENNIQNGIKNENSIQNGLENINPNKTEKQDEEEKNKQNKNNILISLPKNELKDQINEIPKPEIENTIQPEIETKLNGNIKKELNTEIEKIKLSESKNFHPVKFTLIIITIATSIFISFANSNSLTPSFLGVTRCSTGSWILISVYFVITIIILVISSYHVKKSTELKIKNNFLYEHEILLNTKKIILISIVSFFVGLLAALTGLGGSVITTPFLYELNYSPYLTSSFSIFIVFLNKIGSVIGNGLDGFITWDYALFYGIFTLIVSLFTGLALDYIVNKVKRQSIIGIIFILLQIIGLILIIINTVNSLKNKTNIFMANQFC